MPNQATVVDASDPRPAHHDDAPPAEALPHGPSTEAPPPSACLPLPALPLPSPSPAFPSSHPPSPPPSSSSSSASSRGRPELVTTPSDQTDDDRRSPIPGRAGSYLPNGGASTTAHREDDDEWVDEEEPDEHATATATMTARGEERSMSSAEEHVDADQAIRRDGDGEPRDDGVSPVGQLLYEPEEVEERLAMANGVPDDDDEEEEQEKDRGPPSYQGLNGHVSLEENDDAALVSPAIEFGNVDEDEDDGQSSVRLSDHGSQRHRERYASEPASPTSDRSPSPSLLEPSSFTPIASPLAAADADADAFPTSASSPTFVDKDALTHLSADGIAKVGLKALPFSLWDYLQEEVLATDFDSTQEMKWERVTNFLNVPSAIEKIILFGFVVCLDSFLYTFTILPLRFFVAFYKLVTHFWWNVRGAEKRFLNSAHKCDLLKGLLVVLACVILHRVTDASKMYHSVRGQDIIKMHVIFNVLEIADRLCCSFGQDLLDSLFSRVTLARRRDGSQPYLRPLGFFLLSLAYILAHTFVLFYQLVTLNVAINSYDNALLTLLISNQFVEIKGSVFKKFEKENLFQLTCADIVERFQLALMLTAIGFRNLVEVSGSDSGPLPTSFTFLPSLSLLETIFSPVLIVMASEMLVDWLKHAFITKFNHIRPAVYGRFMDVLCRDLVLGGPGQALNRKHTFVDQSPIIARRLGFAALPLACLLIRVTSQVFDMLVDTSHLDECAVPDTNHVHVRRGGIAMIGIHGLPLATDGLPARVVRGVAQGATWALIALIAWFLLIALKLILGTNLVSFASARYSSMKERELEDQLNDRDRPPIGVDKDEQQYNADLLKLIEKEDGGKGKGKGGLDTPAPPSSKGGGKGGGKGGVKLEELSRYDMVKSRIW